MTADAGAAAPSDGLTIGEVSARTGLSIATLRTWETRYGAPAPRRLAGGHRRYSSADVELVRDALRARAAGLSLPAALERARARLPADPPDSIYAGLRRDRPELQPVVFPKRVVIALSHAIEDECCARAERPILFGSFQRERFYRYSEPRWRELARTARLAVVFADFTRLRRPRGAPLEVPLEASTPLHREWTVVCHAAGFAACLAAWELPAQERLPDARRRFETVWSADPSVVRAAAAIASRLARAAAPELEPIAGGATAEPAVATAEDARRVGDLAGRMLAYVGRLPAAAD